MNLSPRPSSLREHSHVVLMRDIADDSLTLYTEDNQSHALGNFWTAESDAIPYLERAIGSRAVADGLVTTAYNFGTALGDVRLSVVVSVDMAEPELMARELMREMFRNMYEEFFEAQRLGEDGKADIHVDVVADRGVK